MKHLYTFSVTLLTIFLALPSLNFAQHQAEEQGPTLITSSHSMIEVASIADQMATGRFIQAQDKIKEFNPKKWGKNTFIPGKGLPVGNDPLYRPNKGPGQPLRTPLLTFQAASSGSTPTDPTGAVGPNHFVNAWNTAFRIWDKAGNPLTSEASLGTLFPGTMGDPIVFYDRYADRFLITEFFSNGFDVAICQGPDPVNDGWYVYRFNTNTFPDYPKFSVWSDGYYITANKDQNSASTSQVVFALERNKMLTGNPTIQMLGFPLTGVVTSGFYSPLGFNCNGPDLPPPGNAPIVYMQDDSWSGISNDHLKIWNINVNWTTPNSSTISAPQMINTTPFDGVFDGGSFSNLPQPSGYDIDALQATIMYMAQYRRFTGHNSAVFNFVVDLDGGDDYSGIRWYELRQTADGAPWSIYQEGTYAQPDGHSAFCGAMCMDANGNIALSYTTVSPTLYPSLRYTGRLASDPPGIMTFAEQVIYNGSQINPASRYGDYAQMTIDPLDDATFWAIGEAFSGGRKNYAGAFQLAPPELTANFNADVSTVCKGGSTNFNDLSQPAATSWNWSFPGASPASSTQQNPSGITYLNSGSYDVTLTVSNGSEVNTLTRNDYINVEDLIAGFSASATSLIVGNQVTFTDASACDPQTWNWTFEGGDPATYNGQIPPPITYNQTGSYDVSLVITKPGASDNISRSDYITVLPPVFTMQNGTITTCTGDFYDSGGANANYSSNENLVLTVMPQGNGNLLKVSFSAFNLENNYDKLYIYDGASVANNLLATLTGTTLPGTYTSSTGPLTFRFTSDNSLNRAGWEASFECMNTNMPPVVNFMASETTVALGETVQLTDLSTNLPTSWLWNITPPTFEYVSGSNGSSQNPAVIFTETGTYTVSLTASNVNGSNTYIKENYIQVLPFIYCTPAYSTGTGDGDYISLVQLNGMANSTGASASPYYTYFSNLSTDLIPGSAYTLTVSAGSYSSNNISAWIDFNIDGVFSEAEKLGNVALGAMPATGDILFTVPADAEIGNTRMRVREVYGQANQNPCATYTYGETEDYNIHLLPQNRELMLTLYLEGLFNGTNMNKVQNASGDQFGGDIADEIVLELHHISPPYALVNEAHVLAVNTDGTASISLPASLGESYYLAIKHRNSIETWNASPLSFENLTISYDFSSSQSQAYGNNLKLIGDKWVIYGGDVNQDGTVDIEDMTPVDNDAANFISGYLVNDINGDGMVDISDMTIVDNNAAMFVGKITP